MLSAEEVKKIAVLARIEVTDIEVEKLQTELSAILTYVEELTSLDTEGIVEVAAVNGLENVFRKDLHEDCDFKDDLLKAAPALKERLIQVKAIL